MYNPEVLEKRNKKVVILGNEAIARGALEAGMGFCACYPGTPSSEVGITLGNFAKKLGYYFEWSTNEKVAFEACAGAAYSGVRSLSAMKHFGLNVASDSVLPVTFTGVKGGLVLVVADDPQGHSSGQSEQDTRYYARMGKIPVLEPSNPQECRDFTKKAFEISERYQIPVIVRTTTMVSHSIGTVKLGEMKKPRTRGRFVKDFERFYNIRPNLQRMHSRLLKKMESIEKAYGKLNSMEGSGSTGIITSGVSYEYIKELGPLNGVRIAKLNLTNPISGSFVSSFLKGLKRVIVLEELEPIIESFVRMVAKDVNPGVRVYGKDILPRVGEYSSDIILGALSPILNVRKPDFRKHERRLMAIKLPARKPVLCPGCPHRSTFYAAKSILGDKPIWAGDIGCYVLGVFEPFRMQDFIISMGASLGVTHGIEKVSNQRVVAFVGDSTFFHAGMPGLANMKHNDPKPIIIIMDNGVTAMTGHQPHPGSGYTGTGEKNVPIRIEDVVRSFGIKNVRVVSAYSQKELQQAIAQAAKSNELSVIVSRGLCRLLMKRQLRSRGTGFAKFEIDPKKCIHCGICTDRFSCPAIIREGKRFWINRDMCWGCSVCSQVCPAKAMHPEVKKQAREARK